MDRTKRLTLLRIRAQGNNYVYYNYSYYAHNSSSQNGVMEKVP